MENSDCSIVKDLMPLYIDGVASEESCRLVEKHLETCDSCRESLRLLREKMPEEHSQEVLPLKKMKREIQKKRYIGAVCGALLVLAISFLVYFHLTSPILLSLEQAEVMVEDREGELYLTTTSPYVEGWEIERVNSPEEGNIVCVTCWDTRFAQLLSKKTGRPRMLRETCLAEKGEASGTIQGVYYYTDDNRDAVPLYRTDEAQENAPAGMQILPRLMGKYLLLAAAAGVVCAALWLTFRKKKAGRYFGYAALFCAAYALSYGFLMLGQGESYFSQRDFAGILLLAFLVWGALLLLIQAVRRCSAKRGRP